MEFALLASLAEEDRRAVLAQMPRRSFRKGDTLFHEGDPGDTLHLIAKGRVAIRPSTRDGDVVTLVVLGPGASFGEQVLTGAASRTASAIALDDVETRVLHRRDLAELRATRPSIDRFLVDVLAAQVRRLTQQVLEALYVPAEQRVIRRLCDLTELYDTGSRPVDIGVRQEDLATMAGTTRPTANRVLQELHDAELVDLRRGHILVRDPNGLARRAR
jgi:CRP/FNR family transcriptional regulator, cyclic AMP receptor protein